MIKVSLSVASLVTVLALSLAAKASVLTFDSPALIFSANQSVSDTPRQSDPALPLYGDHVSAALMYPEVIVGHTGFAYSYGTTFGLTPTGLTPNIGVSYGPGSATGITSTSNPYPVWYPTGFGDLTNVIYQLKTNYMMSVTLTADPGYSVSLLGFDLAGYTGYTNHLSSLAVIVDGGTPSVIGTNFAVSTATHDRYDYSTSPYTGSTVELLLSGDSSFFDNVGLDNVAFSQTQLPEPTSLAVVGFGGALLSLRRRQAA